MNRRGFFGLVGKLIGASAAIGMDLPLPKPAKAVAAHATSIFVHTSDYDTICIDSSGDLTLELPCASLSKGPYFIKRTDCSSGLVTIKAPGLDGIRYFTCNRPLGALVLASGAGRWWLQYSSDVPDAFNDYV